MAIVTGFSDAMVRSLAGVVDFYCWRGIPVARLWPRKTTIPPSAAMLASRRAFIQSRIDLRLVQGHARLAWSVSSVGKRKAWLDYFTLIFMRTWRNFKKFPPVITDFFLFKE